MSAELSPTRFRVEIWQGKGDNIWRIDFWNHRGEAIREKGPVFDEVIERGFRHFSSSLKKEGLDKLHL